MWQDIYNTFKKSHELHHAMELFLHSFILQLNNNVTYL